ncbi:hypothetical protein AAEX28_05355 [Lentisphaerota bacterium WC36G]|nr:hypothetical protein LJT99_08210 [Lentisphaerae bacterium WC36]
MVKNFKKLTFIIGAFFVFSVCFAITMQLKKPSLERFYSGYIIGGELSYSPVTLVNKKNKFNYESYVNPVYIALFVQYDKNRSTSVYDYSLNIAGNSFDCLAIREGDGFFDINNKVYKKTDPNKIYTMLFIVDWPTTKQEIGSKKDVVLKYNLSYLDPAITKKVKFSNIKSNIISEPGKFLKDKELDVKE